MFKATKDFILETEDGVTIEVPKDTEMVILYDDETKENYLVDEANEVYFPIDEDAYKTISEMVVEEKEEVNLPEWATSEKDIIRHLLESDEDIFEIVEAFKAYEKAMKWAKGTKAGKKIAGWVGKMALGKRIKGVAAKLGTKMAGAGGKVGKAGAKLFQYGMKGYNPHGV
jgi:hypothetical protein